MNLGAFRLLDGWRRCRRLLRALPPADLLTRWYELGVFYPMYRDHAAKEHRRPRALGQRPEQEAIASATSRATVQTASLYLHRHGSSLAQNAGYSWSRSFSNIPMRKGSTARTTNSSSAVIFSSRPSSQKRLTQRTFICWAIGTFQARKYN